MKLRAFPLGIIHAASLIGLLSILNNPSLDDNLRSVLVTTFAITWIGTAGLLYAHLLLDLMHNVDKAGKLVTRITGLIFLTLYLLITLIGSVSLLNR